MKRWSKSTSVPAVQVGQLIQEDRRLGRIYWFIKKKGALDCFKLVEDKLEDFDMEAEGGVTPGYP